MTAIILPDEEILACREHPGVWFDGFAFVEDRAKTLRKADPANAIQRELFKIYAWCQDNGVPCNIIGLKSRKEGLSTGATALAYHHLSEHTAEAVCIGTDNETSDTLMKMVRRYAEHDAFPWGSRFRWKPAENRGVWAHGSEIKRDTAIDPKAGRSSTVQVLIACVPGCTPVIMEDGRVRRVQDVKPGEGIMTHTGAMTTVTAVVGAPNCKGALVRIKPCIGGAVSFTFDHRVCTRSGWKEARYITEDDELCMPVRPFSKEIASLTIGAQAYREQGGGTRRAHAGETVPLTKETGFAFGYYLAEGHVFLRNKRTCIGVMFARHREESAFADRAVAALSPWITSHRTDDRKDCLTSTDTIYGVGISELIAENFGRTTGKVLPDWVWQSGRDFCEGLVIGYLSGDGSKTDKVSTKGKRFDGMVSRSVQSSISTQIRDLVASLGWGWGSISVMQGGSRYGRDCVPCYSVNWSGPSARRIRREMGLPQSSDDATRRKRTASYSIEGDRVWLKIRKIDTDEAETVWDLAVEHPEHSFRTLHFACHNTEVAHWPTDGKRSADETMLSILNSMPDIPNLLRIVDSTANGATGFFYDIYTDAVTFEQRKAGVVGNGWIRVFEPWHASPLRAAPITPEERAEQAATLSDREQAGVARFGWTPEQIKWRRETIATKCGGEEGRFDQEYPESEDVAFRASGSPRFNVAMVGKMFARAEAAEKARIAGTPGAPRLGHLAEVGGGIVFMAAQESPWLWISEEPIMGCRYLLPADPMTGEQSAGGKNRDAHAVGILRAPYADARGIVHTAAIVAVMYGQPPFGCQWEMDVLAVRMRLLQRFYGGCLIVPETNTAMDLIPLLRAAGADYLYHRPVAPDASNPSQKQKAVGFKTTSATRNLWVNAIAEAIREESFECLYLPAIKEFGSFIVNADGRAEAAPKKHDDWVAGIGIGLLTLPGATQLLPPPVWTPNAPSEASPGVWG